MARAKYAEWLTEQGLERLAEMAPRLTDAEMAKEMGISPSTYYDWLKKHSEMSEAVTRARTGADARANNESVERSLLETAPRRCPDAQKADEAQKHELRLARPACRKGENRIRRREIYIKPDVKAQIFWLTNREPERWRNKVEAVLPPGSNEMQIVFRGATDEEAASYAE